MENQGQYDKEQVSRLKTTILSSLSIWNGKTNAAYWKGYVDALGDEGYISYTEKKALHILIVREESQIKETGND